MSATVMPFGILFITSSWGILTLWPQLDETGGSGQLNIYVRCKGRRGLVVRRRAGDRLIVSLNPTSARLWQLPRGLAWDAAPEPMVK
jgi:hypothetical protein